MPAERPPAFFLSDGDGYVGTTLARGPWDDRAAHGGPVAALIGRAVERHDPDPDLLTVRYTIELLRPVPLDRLEVEATTVRPGGRVRLVGVSIRHRDQEVARATALRVRRVADDAPDTLPADPPAFAPPEQAAPGVALVTGREGITDAVELRAAEGSAMEPGAAAYWFRVHAPLVDDEPITPLTRLLIAADFGNGIASVTDITRHVFINPDLTVHVHRLPEGEWVANEAVTHMAPGGAARADARLLDRAGELGRASQSLYVAAR